MMYVDALQAVQTVAQRHQARACYARGPFINLGKRCEFASKIQKTNRDGTQKKIKDATKNKANELKY